MTDPLAQLKDSVAGGLHGWPPNVVCFKEQPAATERYSDFRDRLAAAWTKDRERIAALEFKLRQYEPRTPDEVLADLESAVVQFYRSPGAQRESASSVLLSKLNALLAEWKGNQ